MMTSLLNSANTGSASDHYDEFYECYRHWSDDESAGYHFGVAMQPSDVFNNHRMLQNASEMVFLALQLNTSKASRVLDAGCGAGHTCRLFAKKFPKKEIMIWGVTISKKQLELGKSLIAKEQLEDRIQLSLNDFEKLPFENDYFDAVFFQDSICHGTGNSKNKTIREIARVLKPGGKIALTDGFIFPKKGGSIIKAISKNLSRAFGVEKWAIEKEFMTSLEKNGFVDINTIDLTWKSGPSVAQTIYFKLPKVFLSYLRKRLEFKDVVYTFKVALLAPILGLHSYFKYQLISATKQKNKLNKPEP